MLRYYLICALAIPTALSIISFIIMAILGYFIPGCYVADTGGYGCGVIGNAIGSGAMLGFVWAMLGIIGLIPAIIIQVVALLITNLSVKKSTETKKSKDKQ